MKRKPARRFGLIDAMILLTATAVGLAWGRADLLATVEARELPSGMMLSGHRNMRPVRFSDRLITFIRGNSCLLASWSLAMVMIRLRSPRPHRARLMCQPGMVAMATATAYTVATAIGFLLTLLIRVKYKPQWSDYAGQAINPYGIATAIMAAWLILAISGRWRAERTLIDGLGCLIGFAWIALANAGNLFDWW